MTRGLPLPVVSFNLGSTVKGEAAMGGYAMSMADCLAFDKGSESDDWLFRGLVPVGEPAFLFGQPKVGKTWMALDLGLALASGQDWLGFQNPVKRPRRALVITLEDAPRRIARRLKSLMAGRGLDVESLGDRLLVNPTRPFSFTSDQDVAELRATLDRTRPELVVIDSWSRAFDGDENQAKETKTATARWTALCREFDCAIVVTHHELKSGGGGTIGALRGSGDLGAVVRWIVRVKPAKQGSFTVEGVGNVGLAEGPVTAKLQSEGDRVWFVQEGDLDGAIAELLKTNPKLSANRVHQMLGGDRNRVLAEVKRVKAEQRL